MYKTLIKGLKYEIKNHQIKIKKLNLYNIIFK